jgi:hypothetical protein
MNMWWEELLLALLNSRQRQDREPVRAAEYVSYRTQDGRTFYTFSIEQQPNGTFRAYVELMPRAAMARQPLHLLRDNDGRRFVCWTTPLSTPAEARRVAAAWADRTQEYIRTGISF